MSILSHRYLDTLVGVLDGDAAGGTMSATYGMGSSREGAVPNNASRRTFMKGVGLAGAAGLAAPLLASASARAAADGLVLGINAPGPWTTPADETWQDVIHGAVGCRSYHDTVIKTWQEVPTQFPGEKKVAGTRVVASIRPDPDLVLGKHPEFEQAVKLMIADGMTQAHDGVFTNPQLTVWHEAGNLYKSSKWAAYKLTPSRVRSMHVQMKQWCDDVAKDNPKLPRVEYGCIIYGDISKMSEYVPYAPYAMDWYGVDVYYEGDGPTSDCTHHDLSTYALVAQYMGGFLQLARGRSGLKRPKINICECNASAAHAAERPHYFKDLALWLHRNHGSRMLTFFPEDGGPHSVPWPPPQATINALKTIQSTYG
jgi:hypothetical protein